MKTRLVLLALAFASLFLALGFRAFELQVMPNSLLDKRIRQQYTTVIRLPPQRGKILDRNGEELAGNVASQSLFADDHDIKKPKKLARRLAAILHKSWKELYTKLTTGRQFVWVERQMASDLQARIASWHAPGLGFVEENKRVYPDNGSNSPLAAPILGSVNIDGQGLEGLEKKYDADLRGETRHMLARRDARGRPLLVNGQLFESRVNGLTIQTTIDKDLQFTLQKELRQAVLDQQADRALGIIMNPMTGEILAMGTENAKGPTSPHDRNAPVTDVYEPGSTFKIVTAAAALKSGHIFPNTKFFCENGKFRIGRYTIHEAEPKDRFGWLSLSEIIDHSSNIGTTKVAFAVGEDLFRKTIDEFGFLNRTGVDFIGEVPGFVSFDYQKKWPEITLSNVSFGHGIGVTALQLTNAYSAIANGGHLMKPYFVSRVLDETGQTIQTTEPALLRTVLTPSQSALLTLMLTGVTEEGGTGVLARVDGYPVAGKTGTAQKAMPGKRGYERGAYVSSFAGFVPANHPQFTIYVMVDHPRRSIYGAQVAAPVFQRLASYALRKRGFMPIVVRELSQLNGHPTIDPTSATKDANSAATALSQGVMPDMTGRSLKEVAQLLSTLHREVKLRGSGVAINQRPQAGARLSKAQNITVEFKPQ